MRGLHQEGQTLFKIKHILCFRCCRRFCHFCLQKSVLNFVFTDVPTFACTLLYRHGQYIFYRYTMDTDHWPIDYPPLTAFHHALMGHLYKKKIFIIFWLTAFHHDFPPHKKKYLLLDGFPPRTKKNI